jgi:hypothetical protein
VPRLSPGDGDRDGKGERFCPLVLPIFGQRLRDKRQGRRSQVRVGNGVGEHFSPPMLPRIGNGSYDLR